MNYLHLIKRLSYLIIFSLWVIPTSISQNENDSFSAINVVNVAHDFEDESFLTVKKKGNFSIVKKGKPTSILISENDFPGVKKVAGLFQKDLSYVAGQEAKLLVQPNKEKQLIIAGTLGNSEWIDAMVSSGKIDASSLQGKWETYQILTVKNPMPGVKTALVIIGSDKRGTIYGLFDLSREMGVSPWYWWADAPIQSRKNVYVKKGVHSAGEPKVKYRGIFLNDEEPALGNWAREKFGDLNHEFYEKVFELILRQKGNYLWPAMWGKSLWDDDPKSAELANEMGIVLATSHHEPLMRAHVEWDRYGEGAWNYETNREELREFWREGMQRTQGQEKVVTLAMRGDGDEAMGEDTNIELLERIVEEQREIIAEVTGKPATETPQVWALYKEVQDYYDKGMTVPDDVTLLLCDDNWGHVRILPQAKVKPRSGGYGMYYHFDYVGGPRSYKWLNTVQIEKTFEQMRLTYEYGVDRIWLVNVGDLKPMDLPINFFLDYAWNPESIKASDLPGYYTQWASAQFGGEHAKEIGEILALYTKYNARRKPEQLATSTFSLGQFNEANQVVSDWNSLVARVDQVKKKIPDAAHDAFFQLIEYPVKACANTTEMYVAAAKNQLYKQQNRAATNHYADKTKDLFFYDADLRGEHHELADGKWNHIMSQTHIGHVNWRDPRVNKMPDVGYIHIPTESALGFSLESPQTSPRDPFGFFSRSFTPFDALNQQEFSIELFNTGQGETTYEAHSPQDWIQISQDSGTFTLDHFLTVSVDWDAVPVSATEGKVILKEVDGREVEITVPLRDISDIQAKGFIADAGVISMEAEHFHEKNNKGQIDWEIIPNLGRTASAVTTVPVTHEPATLSNGSPSLTYDFTILDGGTYHFSAYFSPSLNFQKDEGLRYAFSVNDTGVVEKNLHDDAIEADWTYPDWWNNAVSDNIMKDEVMSLELEPGTYSLSYHVIDPGLALEKITIIKEGIRDMSYLGPPESTNIK